MTGIVLVSPVACEDRLEQAIGVPGAVVRRWEDEYFHIDPAKVVDDCTQGGVGVVCLGPGLDDEVVLGLAEAFDRDRPDVCVLLLASPTAALWEGALRAGVRDVVDPEVDLSALGHALHRAVQLAERRKATLNQAVVNAHAITSRPSRVITVLSPKGGAGKTTIATNLAIGLGQANQGPVVLVDLDLQFGDVAEALQLSPQQSMADVADAPSDLDATMLKLFLSPHPSGIFVLCAPQSPAEADDISVAHTSAALRLLERDFAFVVVDTSAGISEHTLAAVEESTDLVFVGALDVASVRALRKEIDVLDRLGMTTQQRHLVLNRSDAKVGMHTRDVEDTLGMMVNVAVPGSRLVPLSVNQGTPLLESQGRSPVAKSMAQVVERFVEIEAPAPVPSLNRWRRRDAPQP